MKKLALLHVLATLVLTSCNSDSFYGESAVLNRETNSLMEVLAYLTFYLFYWPQIFGFLIFALLVSVIFWLWSIGETIVGKLSRLYMNHFFKVFITISIIFVLASILIKI